MWFSLSVSKMDVFDSCWQIWVAIMSVLTGFGCVAHLVLLLVILSSPNLRLTPSSFFIISLSLTGLLAASVVFPSAIIVFFEYRSTSTKWCLTSSNCSTNQIGIPPSTCPIFQTLHNFTIYNSAWLVSTIAIERHVSITRPFYAASALNYVLLNVTLTSSSLLLALIPVLLSSDPICYSLYAYHFSDPIVRWTIFVVSYLLPCIVIVVMYFNIYRVAQRTRNTTQPLPSPYLTTTAETNPANLRIWTVNPVVSTTTQTESSQTINKKCNKAIKTLMLTIGTYIGLWSPYWTFYAVNELHYFEKPTNDAIPLYSTNNASAAVTWLMYTSIIINPLLYGLLNRAVRSEFKRKMQILRRLLPSCIRRTQTDNQQGAEENEENFWYFKKWLFSNIK